MPTLTVKKVTNPSGGAGFPFTLAPVTKWGSQGMGNGEFGNPSGVAVDAAGNVYVSDTSNSRMQKFDGNGNYLTQWGSYGTGDGQFMWQYGVAVDGAGNVYVADTGNNRIQKFDSSGNYLTQWGSYGKGEGQLDYPSAVAVDAAGNVYVADTNNARIQKFDSTGHYIAKWGAFSYRKNMPDLNFPRGVAVDGAGNNYVADTRNYRIQRFDANGNYLGEWRRYGRDASSFGSPFGVAVDAAGFIYVADGSLDRIDKFDADGNHLGRWTVKGSGPGIANALAVAVDRAGNVFVADAPNASIVKFGPEVSFALGDGQSITFNGVSAGTYYVGERTIDRWAVSEIDCAGAGSGGSPDVWGDGVVITLDVDDVTCTFTDSDTILPTVAIQQTRVSPTNSSPINFRAVFSEPVTGFASGAVTVGGSAGATTADVTEIAPNDGTTYDVAVSGMTGTGTVMVAVDAGVAQDAAGNLNEASAPVTMIYDLGPTVTINRAGGQANPTNSSPIHFTAVFSEPVTGLVAGHIRLPGTAHVTAVDVTEIAPNDGTTYDIAVSVRNYDSTVSATLDADSIQNAAGMFNQASTSTDNSVNYVKQP